VHLPLALFAVSRIALVKPEKARAIESMILGMAQRRQITAKVSRQLSSDCFVAQFAGRPVVKLLLIP